VLDLCVTAAYFVVIFVLAQVVSRKAPGDASTSRGYFFAGHQLPWWAVGASLIAANISAEQIIGMSGSGFRIGLAVASYEWMAAATLILVGKFALPIFFKNGVTTMPGFLAQRFGPSVRYLMAVFWIAQYVLINLTAILWLGGTAITTVTGLDSVTAVVLLATFALTYQISGGLKAVALTDVVQVTLLTAGGLTICGIALSRIGGHASIAGAAEGFAILMKRFPDHFHMILPRSNPYYQDLPGIAVIVGGMWIMNASYWGFNQYILQRALAAKSVSEAQTGIIFAAYLKLLVPVIVVLPGIAALVLAPHVTTSDHAYPAMMAQLPAGFLGLVFAALVAAIVASSASKINSVATIFTMDLVHPAMPGLSERALVRIGRAAAVAAVAAAAALAQPLLGHFDQVFQFGQSLTGFFAPGITVIFLLGMTWRRCTTQGAFAAILTGFVASCFFYLVSSLHAHQVFMGLRSPWLVAHVPDMPFLNRVGWVFWIALATCVGVSLLTRDDQRIATAELRTIDFRTRPHFNLLAAGIVVILVAIYIRFW
jgi:SSS family solute:Na+ symporter